jgi:hypothetical protein
MLLSWCPDRKKLFVKKPDFLLKLLLSKSRFDIVMRSFDVLMREDDNEH